MSLWQLTDTPLPGVSVGGVSFFRTKWRFHPVAPPTPRMRTLTRPITI